MSIIAIYCSQGLYYSILAANYSSRLTSRWEQSLLACSTCAQISQQIVSNRMKKKIEYKNEAIDQNIVIRENNMRTISTSTVAIFNNR